MGALAIDRRVADNGSLPGHAADIGINEALAAVQRLVGAVTVDLLTYDRDSERAEIVAGHDTGLVPTDTALLGALKAETAFLLTASTPRRMTSVDGAHRARLLVKLVDRSTHTLFLLLNLADSSGVSHARVMRLLPDLVLLIRYHVDLTARVRDAAELKDAALQVLDQGECGVIAVRADHSVVFANAAGAAHLSAETGLRLRRGVLRPADHSHAIRFEAALDSVIDAQGTQRIHRPRANVMLLDAKNGSRPTIVVIAPAGSTAATREPGRRAAAFVYVLQPAGGVLRGLDALCQLHGLSRVESQLIAHLIAGLTLAEAAAEMRIKTDTARAYLKQVFAKTGLHRQADLTTLMTRYLRAIRGDFDFQSA